MRGGITDQRRFAWAVMAPYRCISTPSSPCNIHCQRPSWTSRTGPPELPNLETREGKDENHSFNIEALACRSSLPLWSAPPLYYTLYEECSLFEPLAEPRFDCTGEMDTRRNMSQNALATVRLTPRVGCARSTFTSVGVSRHVSESSRDPPIRLLAIKRESNTRMMATRRPEQKRRRA